MVQKDPQRLSSRFSIAWWFCHFLKPQMRWCSLSGGRQSKWRRLKRRDEEENWNCAKNSRWWFYTHILPRIWFINRATNTVFFQCKILSLVKVTMCLVYLCGPGVSAQSPSSAGSRYKPCCPLSPTRSTAHKKKERPLNFMCECKPLYKL